MTVNSLTGMLTLTSAKGKLTKGRQNRKNHTWSAHPAKPAPDRSNRWPVRAKPRTCWKFATNKYRLGFVICEEKFRVKLLELSSLIRHVNLNVNININTKTRIWERSADLCTGLRFERLKELVNPAMSSKPNDHDTSGDRDTPENRDISNTRDMSETNNRMLIDLTNDSSLDDAAATGDDAAATVNNSVRHQHGFRPARRAGVEHVGGAIGGGCFRER